MPEDVVIAGLLHDSVERGDVLLEAIVAGFGDRIAQSVAALTEDDRIEAYEERKAALRDQVAAAGRDAASVFAADKVSSARNIRRVVANGRVRDLERMAPELRRKFAHYEHSLVMLEQVVPHLTLVREFREELEALRSDLVAHSLLEPAPA
jgi:(p)ppGpp synthase/HD superfamily hydrolase